MLTFRAPISRHHVKSKLVQVVKNDQVEVDDKHKLWCDIGKPRNEENLIENVDAIKLVDSWLQSYKTNSKSGMLFIHGESGTGKSTTVDILCKKHGYKLVHTFANNQRTPAKLEGVVREAGMHGSKGIVILDDFEFFLSETMSLRVLSKFMRDLISKDSKLNRVLFVIISNSADTIFSLSRIYQKLWNLNHWYRTICIWFSGG